MGSTKSSPARHRPEADYQCTYANVEMTPNYSRDESLKGTAAGTTTNCHSAYDFSPTKSLFASEKLSISTAAAVERSLQETTALVRNAVADFPLQFKNFRD